MQKILTAICLTIILSIPLHAQSTKYTAQEILNSVYVNELGNPPAFNTQYSMQNIFNAVYNDTNALRVKVTGSLTVSSLTVTGNAFSVGGSTLVVVDGKVGIGTNILFAPLSVASPDILDTPSGAITMSRKLVNIGDTRSSSIFHFYNSATNQDTLGLAVSADYLANRIDRIKMAIQLNGNVGIGTTGPEYKLDVAGTFNIPADTWMTGAGRGLIRDTHFGYSSIYRVLQVGDISVRGLALGVDPTTVTGETFTGTGEIALPNSVEFIQKNSGGTDWIQNVLVLNNGNVGIGITTPQGLLHVGAGATPGLLVTSAGDVGIGTTNPAATLEVVGQFRPQQVAVGSIAALAPRGLGNVIVCTTCTNPYSLCISTSATVAGSWILVNTASSHCQ